MKGENKMEGSFNLLEGVGWGTMGPVVMGKLAMEVDLLKGIEELVKREHIQTGVILSGIGALKRATFRNLKRLPPDLKVENRDRLYLDLEQPMEIVSLTGWIARREDGSPEIHAHFSASTVINDQVVTLGGHLTSGTITSVKVVVFIGVLEKSNIEADLDPRLHQIDVRVSG